jgi:zinc transport system substrate-binding protein
VSLRIVICFGLLAAWGLSAAESLRVCVSLPPLMCVAQGVGGDRVEVTSFMSENDDPHTFSATPRSIARLRDCDVFVGVGAAFEEIVFKKVRRMFPELTVVELGTGADCDGGKTAKEADDHEHGETCGGLHDPHTWLSIRNLIQMAEPIRDALSLKRPKEKGHFSDSCATFQASMEKRHAELAKRLAPHRDTTFYVYHPAFGYFARDYSLVQKSVEIDGKSPAPRQLMALITQAKNDGVQVIFVQPQFNEKPARILAKRIGGRVVPLNPLGADPLAVMAAAADAICSVK